MTPDSASGFTGVVGAVSTELTIDPAAELDSIKVNGETLESTNYEFADGILTFKAEYTNALTAGSYVFTVADSNEKTAEFALTVADPEAPTIDPTTFSVAQGAAVDNLEIGVTFNNEGETLASLKNGSSEVNAENYTFEDGTLTLKVAYVNTLTAGEKTFKVTGDKGGTANFVVTVTGE